MYFRDIFYSNYEGFFKSMVPIFEYPVPGADAIFPT